MGEHQYRKSLALVADVLERISRNYGCCSSCSSNPDSTEIAVLAKFTNYFPTVRRGAARDEARFGNTVFMFPETRASIGMALVFGPNS